MKLFVLGVIVAVILLFLSRRKRRIKEEQQATFIEDGPMHELLQQHVPFYHRLPALQQPLFRERVVHFLKNVKITAIGSTQVTTLDQLLIGSSAIIPIFAFPDWAYNNLDEVLVYPDLFTTEYNLEDKERNVAGMVGDGAMHRMMILSLPALRAGFEQNSPNNTAIHEFVHLLDKADGATDGIPTYMLPKSLVTPWIAQMHRTIQEIREQHSDLNPYAATNEAEFFAVLSEYFFQKPEFLKEHHPKLFELLEQTYGRHDEQTPPSMEP